MDPQKPESFNHRTAILATSRKYHFVDQLPVGYDPQRTATLLCVHGFPDLWFGWRYQIGPWVRRGCRVVVPDMLGYGETEKPVSAQEYTTKKLCADLSALLDLLGIERAVLIGHDWGAFIVGRFALWYPDRLLGLVMMSVPYTPPSRVYIPLTEVVKRAPNLGYQLYFAASKSSFEILVHLKKFITLIFRPPTSDSDFTPLGSLETLLHNPHTPNNLNTFLTEQEKEYYYKELSKGMNGPLNYYRTSSFRHEEEIAAGLSTNLRSDLPFLFVWGTEDATVTTSVIAKSRKFISRYQEIALEGRGHWIMTEAKEEVTERIADWLEVISSPHHQTKL